MNQKQGNQIQKLFQLQVTLRLGWGGLWQQGEGSILLSTLCCSVVEKLLAHKHPDFSASQSKTCLEHGCGIVGFLMITIGVFLIIRIIIIHRNLL